MPPDHLAETITCKATACAGCGGTLDGSDQTPHRHQVAEVPPIRPVVIEYQPHRLTCPGCGKANRGLLPEGVPAGSFGHRPRAKLNLLAAGFRLARRPVRRNAHGWVERKQWCYHLRARLQAVASGLLGRSSQP